MDFMQLFWIVWMFILPILGITLAVLAPIIWFFIVPKVARMLTWCRFRNVSIHAIADDSGYVELVPTNVELPEGVVRTKRGWRFLPRPRWKTKKEKRLNEKKRQELDMAEQLGLRKYVLKGLGKPFWFGYAGKITAMNPATLAALQQTNNPHNPTGNFQVIEEYIKNIAEPFRKDLTKMLTQLKQQVKAKSLTLINTDAIKTVVPQMYPASLIDALATNREYYGMKRRGREYTGLILGGALIIGLVIFGIIALMMVFK